MALPNLAVVGFPKCGSTTLFGEFRQVPEIMTSPIEESTAFTGPMELENSPAMLEAKFYAGYAGQPYIVDVHPALAYSRANLERMRRVCGEMKVICVLRDPWARSVSNYKHSLRWLAENRTMEEAFDEDLANPITHYQHDGRTIKHHLSLSRYEVFVPQIWEVFGRENVFILPFEDYYSPTGHSRQKLIEWLGLEPRFYPAAGATHNNKGGTWTFETKTKVSFTMDGQEVFADRFVGVMNADVGNFEWFVVEPTDGTWAWFGKAQASVEANKSFDAAKYAGVFDETIRFCEEEVFGRDMAEWRSNALARAA